MAAPEQLYLGSEAVATDARAGGDGGHCKNIHFSGVA